MIVGLQDRVVLITGAASGIGAAIAREVANAGAAGLMLTDRDTTGLETIARELHARHFVADLASPDAPGKIMQATLQAFGRVDGLVNAAGLTTRAALTKASAAAWDMLFAVNSRAPFFLMQAAVADMLARKAAGAIVNILSINAHCGSPDLAVYSASKGALAVLTKNTAQAHMADRIRANGIHLGWVATPSELHMQAEILGRGTGWLAEEEAKAPLGRLVQAEEAARLAVFMLSDASAPMSGVLADLEQHVTGAPR
ncbi:oxidoreductase [Abyssibius alkaniclasticus]|uniref:oxidoreductase n=1 Tax=Abyssibius alkaniclasticus TaxID=2881234 RepID=UPI00405897F4